MSDVRVGGSSSALTGIYPYLYTHTHTHTHTHKHYIHMQRSWSAGQSAVEKC